MKSRARFVVIVAIIVAAATALASCSSGSSSSSDKTSKLRISATGIDSLPFMAILQVGIDKGWFKDEGIDASLYSGGGGGNTLRVVTSGDADIAITGGTSVVLAAREPAANLEIVGSWFQINDFYWLASKQDAALKGATLGFSSAGSSTELIAKAIQAARKDDNIETQAVGGIGDNWAATKANRITAGWAMHPFVTQLQQDDGAHVLVAARDIIGDSPADLVVVNKDYAKNNPEQLKAFFRVADKLFKYVISDTDAAAADIAPLMKLDPALVAKGIKETPDYRKGYSLKVDGDALDRLSGLMEAAGQIQGPIDWSKTLNQEYLPKDAQTDLK